MTELSWETYEFAKHEKSAQWYVILWLIAVALIVLSFVAGNYIVIGLVVVGALVITLYAAKVPRRIVVSLHDDALKINDQVLKYDDLASFWIFDHGDEALLSIHRRGLAHPSLSLFMPNEYAARARLLLRPRVVEEEHEESLIDVVADRLKF